MFVSMEELCQAAGSGKIAQAALRKQAQHEGASEDAIRARMHAVLGVMKTAVRKGLQPGMRSLSGMTGGGAARLMDHAKSSLGGEALGRAMAYALASAEYNAAMGKIVAAPTAGACGILPGAFLAMQEMHGFSDDVLVDALLTAAAVGAVIAKRASISGAEAGCQAECGSAAAMAAAALVEMFGGTPAMAADACAFALMNCLGLVCDPVDGLVEVPCVYRNVSGVAGAISAADIVLSGTPSPIDPDNMIDTMGAVGAQLPTSLRETGEGGCAACGVRRGIVG